MSLLQLRVHSIVGHLGVGPFATLFTKLVRRGHDTNWHTEPPAPPPAGRGPSGIPPVLAAVVAAIIAGTSAAGTTYLAMRSDEDAQPVAVVAVPTESPEVVRPTEAPTSRGPRATRAPASTTAPSAPTASAAPTPRPQFVASQQGAARQHAVVTASPLPGSPRPTPRPTSRPNPTAQPTGAPIVPTPTPAPQPTGGPVDPTPTAVVQPTSVPVAPTPTPAAVPVGGPSTPTPTPGPTPRPQTPAAPSAAPPAQQGKCESSQARWHADEKAHEQANGNSAVHCPRT